MSPKKLVKPLKGTNNKWSSKERLMVLGLLLLTLFTITLFWLKGKNFTAPQISLSQFKSLFALPESKIVFEAQQFLTPTLSPRKIQQVTEQFTLLTQDLKGTYGFYVYRLNTHTSYGLNHQDIFPAASLTKLSILIALYQAAEAHDIDLDQPYTLKDQDQAGGAGNLQYAPAGTQKTYRELAKAMGQSSDNTAARIITNLLGEDKIQATIDQIGMTHTSYQHHTTTPADTGLLLQKLHSNQLLSLKHQQEILSFLTLTDWEDLIPAGLPPGIKVAHKYASEVNTWSDAGIIDAHPPFVLVIMSRDTLKHQAFQTIPQITKFIYENETN